MLFKILFPIILIFSNAYSFNRLKVIVTIEPYQYLVQRIGKTKVKVQSTGGHKGRKQTATWF